jgi:hypothetical protein
MRKVSWILLMVVGAFTLLAALASAGQAYSDRSYGIGPASIREVAAGRPEVETALRGMRGTAAAYAAGFGTLILAMALGPYRRGDVATWWAMLAGTLVMALVTVARVPLLGMRAGSGAALTVLALVLLALLLDVGRLRKA